MGPLPPEVASTGSRMVENGGYGAALVVLGIFCGLGWWLYIRATITIAKMNTEQQALGIESARASDKIAGLLGDLKAVMSIVADRLRR